ncbi:MAG TPA: hypothetical protein VE527_03755, partial [Reyranella sp.]|nr:hypothetical protein [Reyranella sp.]
QLNTVFADQGLPRLGYMTDLLYIASAIAAASFNDITIGNNTSSFFLGGDYKSNDVPITPTGYGYHAEVGYDLVRGLGTPNGLLLARALSEIGHHQMYFSDSAPLIEGSTAAGWTSGAAQTLLVQASIRAGHDASLDLGGNRIALQDAAGDSFAWTPRLAQQSLQPDFDPTLVRMFDKQSQGWVGSRNVADGEDISARTGASDGVAKQAGLTSAYGLADFSAHDGVIHLARAVAVAETAGGANDQNAIVRVRQNGEDSLSVAFYRVDDLGYDRRRRARRRDLRCGGGNAFVRAAGWWHGDGGTGLRAFCPGADRRRRCRPSGRPAAHQPCQRPDLLRLRSSQWRQDGPPRELRHEHLGLRGPPWRRRPRLQRPRRAARFHQRLRPWLAGLGLHTTTQPVSAS